MKMRLLLLIALLSLPVSQALALVDGRTHMFITGPYNSGQEVTKLCIGCHENLTWQIMKTVHWTWSKQQSVNGKSIEYGKKNAIGSNGCFALPSNWEGCTTCHAGYGWAGASFDFSKPENVDCLVCHETTLAYKKGPGGDPALGGEAGTGAVDLAEIARSVARPRRTACGFCHFNGGGGDGYKHGDLDSSLDNPTPEIDVHMGGKTKFTCESCHKAEGHGVKGEAISVSPGAGPRAMGCTDCHTQKNIHKSVALNNHMRRVACQTCHIPFYAKGKPTVISWNWSTAGKDPKPEEMKKDQGGDKLYDKTKGDLTLGKNLVPTYMWYSGSVERALIGEKINPTDVVRLSAPRGDRNDPEAKIYPFKVLKARQPYDTENNTLAVVNFYGPPTSESAYWVKFDWNKAIDAGMKAAGQPYSGKYGWVDTTMVWSLNHMVAPKEQALRCIDCHEKGRINWKELGYHKDLRLGRY